MSRLFIYLLLCSLCLTCGEAVLVEPVETDLIVDADGFTNWQTHMNALVKWKVSGTQIQAQIQCPFQGWAALGFNTISQMTGANIIIGFHDNTGDYIEDSLAITNPRRLIADTALNPPGEDDVIDAVITEDAKGTTLSFTLPLSSTNNNGDIDLSVGSDYFLLAACSSSDDFVTDHTLRGRAIRRITL